VGIDRLAVAYRLAADHVGADHQVTEWQVRIDGHAALRLLGRRERKHVGGLVLATPQAIELAAFALAHDAHRDFAAITAPAQRRRGPAIHARPRRRPGPGATREVQLQAVRTTHVLSEGA
jgi:hypothetical protein